MNEVSACIDVPDERDWIYSELCGASNIEYPKEFVIDDIEDYQDQSLQKETWYGCVFFSTNHWVNILNELEWVWEENYSWVDFCKTAVSSRLLDVDSWAAIQNWPSLAKQLKRISGWAKIQTNEFKHSLFVLRQPIVVWSKSMDWSNTILKEKAAYWHAFLIIGWNATGWIVKNSYWKKVWDNWKFILPYELEGLLFPSKYSLIDEENSIITYKKKIMEWINIESAKKAFEKGIWNGLNATAPVTREETAAMIMRAIEKFILK